MLSLYLQYIKGLEPDQAGLILVAQPIIMTFFSPYAGRLSDRREPRLVSTAGMVLTFVGIFSFVFLSPETSIIHIAISLVILGFGLALFASPNTNAIMSSIAPRSYGVGSATLGTMRLVGQVLSMGIAMLVFSVFLGNVEILPEYYPQFLASVKVAFIIFSALCFLGVFASMARGSLRKEEMPGESGKVIV